MGFLVVKSIAHCFIYNGIRYTITLANNFNHVKELIDFLVAIFGDEFTKLCSTFSCGIAHKIYLLISTQEKCENVSAINHGMTD